MEHIESHTGRFIGSRSPQAVKSATFRFSSAHVLYGRLRPYLNKAIAPDFEGHCSTEIFPIKPSPAVDRQYLLYWLLADETTNRINGTCSGARMPRADMNEVLGFEFPLPPLTEQRRIVALLDEAFAGLATAAANAERNLDNARELFESHLAEVFSRRGDGWVERRLADVVSRLTNGYVGPTRGIYVDDGVPYLLARHVKDNTLKFDGRTFVTQAFNQRNKKSILKAGDVLLVQSGHIGHSAVVSPEHEGHNCHAMIVISPVLEIVSGEFLSLYFNSHEMRRRFDGIRSGSTVPHLTCGAVREELIPIPGHEAQRRIVEHARQFVFEARELSKSYSKKQAALAALKRSLLHQAFSGAL